MNLKRKSEKLSSAISSVWINLKSIKGRILPRAKQTGVPWPPDPDINSAIKLFPVQDQSIWYQYMDNTCSLKHGNADNKCL